MAWLSGWSKRIKFTLDSGKVDAALSDFPVMVYLSGSSGIGGADVSAIFDEIGSSSLKIAVTGSDGTTQCPVEIEKWDCGNEKAWLWVKVPSVSDSADTDLYLYYDSTHADNSTYVGAIGSTPGQNVWDSDFSHVYHLRDSTVTVPLYLSETSASGNPAMASRTFSAVDCRGLTKANGTLVIDLKVTEYNDISLGVIEITSSGTYDSQEWYHVFPNGITDAYQAFEIPLSDWGTDGGELDVKAINYIRIYAYPDQGSSISISWKNAYIKYTEGIADSTSNENRAVKRASGAPAEASGRIDKGQDFDGSDDVIFAASSYDSRDAATLEAICKLEQNGSVQRLVSLLDRSEYSEPQYYLRVTSDDYARVLGRGHSSDSAAAVDDTVSLNDSNFHYVAGTINGNTGSVHLFVDGTSKGTNTTSQFTLDTMPDLLIGLYDVIPDSYKTQPFSGVIDEVRVSSAIRSSAWIKATYYTCWDTLVTFGSEETQTEDIILTIPAFVASADLLSTLGIQLSIPAMAGQNMLSAGPVNIGYYVPCVPFVSASALAGSLKINLAVPALESQSVLKGYVGIHILAPAFEHQGILSLSDIFIGQYVDVPAFTSVNRLNGDLCIYLDNPAFPGHSTLLGVPTVRLLIVPFGAVAALHMASINKFTIDNAEIYYTFVLSGGADGTTDITIPIKNFQARLRSGDPTYLSVTVPGKDYAAAISARPNGEMIIYMHYYSAGLLLQTEEIIRVDLEDINISEGAKSTSIVLTGHKTMTMGGRTVTLRNPTYRNLYRGKFTYRCATPDIFLRPGDTVICGDDAFDVDLITYVVSVAQQSMEITGT